MKKNFFYATALVLGLAFTATACSDDDDNSRKSNLPENHVACLVASTH